MMFSKYNFHLGRYVAVESAIETALFAIDFASPARQEQVRATWKK